MIANSMLRCIFRWLFYFTISFHIGYRACGNLLANGRVDIMSCMLLEAKVLVGGRGVMRMVGGGVGSQSVFQREHLTTECCRGV